MPYKKGMTAHVETGYEASGHYGASFNSCLPTYLGISNGYDVSVLVKSRAIEGKPKVFDLCVIK